MAEDPVVTALRTALAAAPDRALHIALGDRLMTLGQAVAALDAYQQVLALHPADTEALGKAASAADASGEGARAVGYRTLLSALGASEAQASPVAPAAPQPTSDPTPMRLTSEGGATGGGPGLRLVGEEEELPMAGATFADVGGLEQVKKRIDLSFLAPIRNPGLFKAYGKSIKGGLLLYGPPGCGKTHIARATAGEVGARFVSVGLIDVIDMYIGESEKRLHEIFETARRQSPTVLFLDELDAIGQKRSQLRHSAGRNVVNQLLVELDGLDSQDGVYVIAATNHPWDVDPALKRPGRFDRTVLITPPDLAARVYILERHMSEKPSDGLDFKTLAAKTHGFSGADLVHLADTAVERVLDEILSGKPQRSVTMADFGAALREVQPSTRPWTEMARNYALYANEGGAYDDLADWLKKH
ncbi:MAG: ATP-binding protein [Proteobacteria bacterium]|nr:ATP-binding protein [Pseudomonadota bacterium]